MNPTNLPEIRYRALIENSADAIVLVDARGNIVYASPSVSRILGTPNNELIGTSLFQTLHPDDVAAAQHLFAQVLETPGMPFGTQVRLRHRDGSWRWIDATATNLLADPSVKAIVGNYRDITRRKQAEDALRQSEAQHRALVEQAADGIFISNTQGRYLDVNTNGCAMLGYTHAEILGMDYTHILLPEDLAQDPPKLDVLIAGKTLVRERLYKRKDGTVFPVEISAKMLSDGRVQNIVRDITERKQAEEALRRSEEKYRYLFERNPNSMWVFDLETLAFLAVNEAAIRQYGYTRAEFMRMTLKDVRLPEDVPALVESVAEIQPGLSSNVNVRHRLKDGRLIDVEITSQPITFEGRNARLVSPKDVSEQGRARQQLRKRADELAALYETTRELAGVQDLGTLLRTIVDRAQGLLAAESGAVHLFDPARDDLELVVVRGVAVPAGTRFALGEGVAGHVAQTRRPLRVDDYGTWGGRSTRLVPYRLRAGLGVPMIYGGELIGVLTMTEVGETTRKFTESDERLLSLFAGHAASAVHSARTLEQVRRQLQRLAALRHIDMAISTSVDLGTTLNMLLQEVTSQLGVDAAAIYLLDPSSHMLEFAAGQGFRTPNLERGRTRLGEGHAGRAVLERRLVAVPDLPASGSEFFRASLLAGDSFIAYYGMPLLAKGQVRGILEVFHRAPLDPDPEWLDFFAALAGQAAIAIDDAQLFSGLQRSNLELILAYDTTIEGWSRALDLRDKETEGHTQRVTELTMRLARTVQIQDADLVHWRRGALLHDIGKMGVPDTVLLKPGALTDEEWVLMRRHPIYAYELLSPIAFLRPALDIPYAHHEKWDGTGYPRGLIGEQIPLAARLFAIVDVWDALRSDRPYRAAWPEERVREHIKSLAGTHFDPKVVADFLRMV